MSSYSSNQEIGTKPTRAWECEGLFFANSHTLHRGPRLWVPWECGGSVRPMRGAELPYTLLRPREAVGVHTPQNKQPSTPHTCPARANGYALTMRRTRGQTTHIQKYLSNGWRQEPCPHCSGRGLAYAHRDGNPQGPITGMERCRQCKGRGSTWRSPGGMRAAYPGGPWL